MKRSIPLWLMGTIVAVVGALVAAYIFAIGPQRSDAAELDEEIAALEVQLDAARLAESRAEADQDRTAIEVADLVELAKALPDEVDMAGIMVELDSAAAAAGVEFTAIEPGAPSAADGYTVIPITITFEGSYYDLTEFLYQVRNLVTVRDGVLDANGRLVKVDGVNLAEGEDGFPQVQAVLTVSAYQFGVDPAAIAASGGLPVPTDTTQTTTTATDTTATTETTTTAPTPPPSDSSGGVQQAQGGNP